jgi:superfamily II DNA or RNA helicase
MNITLRPYQAEAVNAIRISYSQGKRAPLLVLATGSGKTIIFCDIAERTIRKNNRVLILVHRQELLRQTSDHLRRLGVAHGLIAPGYSMTADNIQVGSKDTVIRRLGKLHKPHLIICDEAHHYIGRGTFGRTLSHFPEARVLGVTATPERLDGQGLGVHVGGFFDQLIEGPDIRELIRMGFLSQPLVYAPPVGMNLQGIHKRGGDFDAKEIEVRADKPKITGCVISHYRRLCNGMPAIAFCATVKHAEDVAAEFQAAGIRAAALSGKLPDNLRARRVAALGSGELQVLTACDIVSEGTDIPVVGAAILLRPTASFGLCRQQIGRALRPYPGKSAAIILDHVGNCIRHGLPDDPHIWSLDGELTTGNKKPTCPLRVCRQCFAVFGAWMIRCPQCGADVEAQEREIARAEGELVLISAAQEAQAEADARAKRMQEGRAQTLQDLLAIAKERNYSPGWAYIRWNIRQKKKAEANRFYQEALAV